jgi:CheY-like chemotaxis protein
MNPDSNRRILIIDDNKAIHDDFRKILAPDDPKRVLLDLAEKTLFGEPQVETPPQFEIDSSYQGAEGVQRVQEALQAERPYAVAFVDMRMPPGWDGLKTAHEIGVIDSEIQIVICTAYAAYSWDEISEKSGHHGRLVILKKPFDTVEALRVAHALTEKWHSIHLTGNDLTSPPENNQPKDQPCQTYRE